MEYNPNKYKSFKQIINLFYNEELEKLEDTDVKKHIQEIQQVKLEPKLIFDSIDGKIKLEIFIGNENMYKIKRLSEFYNRMLSKENYKYGENFEFLHTRSAFLDSDLPLLDFVLKYAEIINYGNTNSNTNYRFGAVALCESQINIDKVALDILFDTLKNKKIKFKRDLEEKTIRFVPEDPEIKFILSKTKGIDYTLNPNIDLFKLKIISGNTYMYVLNENALYRCSKEFEETTMKLVNAFIKNYIPKMTFSKEQLPLFFSIMMPKVKNSIKIELDDNEFKKYLPKKLTSKLFLDFDNNNYLVADLKFNYDGIDYNPLKDEIKNEKFRNSIEETKLLNILRKTGFMLDTKNLRFILTDDDKIYEFIISDINRYMESFEILVTDNFKSRHIRQPKISSLQVKIENNLLEVDFKNLNIDTNELALIMEKYRLKKKYYKLEDGTFINLEGNKYIDFLNNLITGTDMNLKELTSGVIRLPVYRTMYLNQLLDKLENTTIDRNKEYDKVIYNLDKNSLKNGNVIPQKLNTILRDYQKVGAKWLKELDNYHLGGILADDMGLGKTIQILSIITSYVEDRSIPKKSKKASLVVSPSSLALNWKSEAEKFAPQLRTLVISGSSFERKKQIESIDNYDLIITSYDLLKRDIEFYIEKKYQFKYIIADEAQYLKNSSTQNAIAIKQINSETRYALTGTPMENSLAELWSIFDFIMPGYLFSYRKFRNLYESPIVRDKEQETMKKLKMLIEPFILRRTKKEVLTELPEKTVTVLTSDMKDEQKKLYFSYLAEAKEEIKEIIEINGAERSNIKILAVFTRLRQICCHPSVFIENYEGGSSKLEQCMELVKNGVESGHKILIFSGYTSIFPIMEQQLEEKGINYFKLTGSTKVNERIDLIDEFNNNDEIKVFLISLKAGGTGLNLTGADMVIHYDPWWNASAENQATDRAYRIGQKSNVYVYKLITKDSIEEKIYELQQKKSILIDNVLNINTSFVNKLTRDEIMELFE